MEHSSTQLISYNLPTKPVSQKSLLFDTRVLLRSQWEGRNLAAHLPSSNWHKPIQRQHCTARYAWDSKTKTSPGDVLENPSGNMPSLGGQESPLGQILSKKGRLHLCLFKSFAQKFLRKFPGPTFSENLHLDEEGGARVEARNLWRPINPTTTFTHPSTSARQPFPSRPSDQHQSHFTPNATLKECIPSPLCHPQTPSAVKFSFQHPANPFLFPEDTICGTHVTTTPRELPPLPPLQPTANN